MTVTEWCRYWHEELYQSQVRFSTWQSRKYVLETHIYPCFEGIELTKLTQKDVQRFLKQKQKSYSTAMVSNIYKTLHMSLKSAVEQGRIATNPADGLNIAIKPKCKTKPLTEFQTAEYLCAAENTECEAMLRLIAEYGLRPKEVCGLRWADFDPKNRELTINYQRGIEKGKLVDYGEEFCRKITLTSEMAKLIKSAHKQHPSSEVMFVHKGTLKPYTQKMLRSRHKEVLAKTELPEFRLSDLHHSYAIRLFQNGKNAKEVALIVGGSRSRALRSYYKDTVGRVLKQEIKKSIIEVKDQEEMISLIENLLIPVDIREE